MSETTGSGLVLGEPINGFNEQGLIVPSWDVDDVLIKTAEHTINLYNAAHGTHLTIDDWYTLDEAEIWGVVETREARERVDIILNDPEFSRTVPVMPGLLKVIQLLEQSEHVGDQFAVTGRPDTGRVETAAMLDFHYPGSFRDSHLHMTDHMKLTERARSKADVLQELGATHHTDDHDDHIVPIALSGIIAVRFGGYKWQRIAHADLPELVVLAGDADGLGEFYGDELERVAQGRPFEPQMKRIY